MPGEKENGAPEAPKAEAPKAVLVGAATDVKSLSDEEEGWILRAAAKIQEAEKAAADKAEADKRQAEMNEQTLDARRKRQAEAQAK